MLCVLMACSGHTYTLTIFISRPDGRSAEEVHKISAATDSIAYTQGTTTFLLALHAYKMMMDNAKPFISKPTGFVLTNQSGNRVDSLLGEEKARMIKNRLDTFIN